MTSDVVLTAALRNNLLSLQKTQTSIDKTQLNLATGRKVNSALDGPQAFFASQALNNRASDLTRLLDGIGQSIQVIKAADNGITALTCARRRLTWQTVNWKFTVRPTVCCRSWTLSCRWG